jgi:hypothetical protein
MTFPLGEYLILKMRHYYHFESNPLVPEKAHIALPTGPGFNDGTCWHGSNRCSSRSA